MSKKSDYSEAEYGRIGFMKLMPLSKGSISQHNECRELQQKTRSSYKDEYGGGSSNFTQNYKAEAFVDESSGRLGYKQEANYTSTNKYVDKELGYTTEYQTQVKFKKSVYPNKTTQVKFKKSGYPAYPSKNGNKYNNNRIDYY